ncbi:hypothetical protein ACWA43_00310 [Xanthomonas axonopodis pv. ricini]
MNPLHEAVVSRICGELIRPSLRLFLLAFLKSRKDSAATRKEGHEKWLRQATREVTDIAIGYWVEAKHAEVAADEVRMLHALIECHYYIGIINSPLTHSEAMRAQGSKQGLQERKALEQAAIEVLTSWMENRPKQVSATKPRKPVKPFEKESMMGHLAQELLDTPRHQVFVVKYDESATKGKTVENDLIDRLTDTLLRWATKEARKHPEFSAVADKASRLLVKPQSHRR